MISIALCTEYTNAAALVACGVDSIEENIQRLLMPRADDATFAETLAAVRRAPLPVLAANAFLPGDLRCVGPVVDTPALLRYGQIAFARAEQVGIRTMVIGSGAARQVPDGWAVADADVQFCELLGAYAPLAAQHGVTVVVEALNRGECNYLNTLAAAAAIVDAVAHPAVQLLTDFYHMLRDDEPASEITRFGRLIRHAHIAEKTDRTVPGRAGDDFGPFFRALQSIGYQGGIAVEARYGADLVADATLAVAQIRAGWQAAQRP
ncbi:MAG: hypothetical protein RLZZ297_666 [Chloroflexota bacterium]